jgi:hypothetical protein
LIKRCNPMFAELAISIYPWYLFIFKRKNILKHSNPSTRRTWMGTRRIQHHPINAKLCYYKNSYLTIITLVTKNEPHLYQTKTAIKPATTLLIRLIIIIKIMQTNLHTEAAAMKDPVPQLKL